MNDIIVRPIFESETDKTLWQDYIGSHPDSTAYHSIAWRAIFENSFGYRSWYLLAQKVSDDRVVGCLPLFLVASPISRRLVSVPFRDRGGILWDIPEAFDALLTEAKRIATSVKAAFIELKTIQTYPSMLAGAHGLQERLYWVRSSVDLRALDIDIFFKKIGPKTRNMLRQAEKASLIFEDVTNLAQGLDVWYALYLSTQKHLGLPPFPMAFFRDMYHALNPTNEIKVFRVRKGDEYLASTIILLSKKVAIYGYSASKATAQCFRPNDFNIFNLIKWAIENGFDEFDMGSDSPEQESLLFFKKKWLAKQEVIPVYTFGNVDDGVADSSDGRYDLIREGFRYLPTGVLKFVGERVAKYFG